MENSIPSVSIIMNCYNSEEYLREAIDSVYAQSYKDWEIVFWDDGSTDSSPQIAKSYDDKLQYFRGEKASSLGEARNWAIGKARGVYIAFLDCDDIWLPDKLEKQVRFFEKDPRVGLVFSDAIYFNKRGDSYRAYENKKPSEGNVFSEYLKEYSLPMVTVMIKTEALRGLSDIFDKRFGFIEEMDLFLRIMHDWRIAYADEVLAKYRMHEKSWTFSHGMFFPEEKKILIEKFIALYPNFEKEYADELTVMRRQVAYEKFLSYWRDGKRAKARTFIKSRLGESTKLKILYTLSFAPFTFYLFLRKILRMDYYWV